MKVNELEISNPNVTPEEVRKYINVTIADYLDKDETAFDEKFNEIFYKYGWIEHMKNPKGDIDSFVKFLSQANKYTRNPQTRAESSELKYPSR